MLSENIISGMEAAIQYKMTVTTKLPRIQVGECQQLLQGQRMSVATYVNVTE